MTDKQESDRLVIKTLRSAIVCAWLVMACMIVSVVINTCGQRNCSPCNVEKP